MSYAIIAALGIAACWKWGDWRNWKLYYPTILYAYIGDLIYDVLAYSHPLWAFGDYILNHPYLDLAMMVLLYPSSVILYLTHFPEKTLRQVAYIAIWSVVYTLIEGMAYLTKGFIYLNGWNLYYSLAFNAFMFPLLRLHFKRPLVVWPVSAALAFLVVWWFRVPLGR